MISSLILFSSISCAIVIVGLISIYNNVGILLVVFQLLFRE